MTSISHVFRDGFALLIGVGYCTDQSLSLPGTVNDARTLEKALKNPEQCGYPPGQVNLIVNDALGVTQASKRGILNGLNWLEEHTTDRSTVIIYFSGHAKRDFVSVQGNTESFYLIPGNCDLKNIASTAISAKELSECLALIRAQKILIILDCCHAGGFGHIKGNDMPLPESFTKFADPNQIYAQLGKGRGHVLLLSSSEDQSSWLMKDKKSSIFTHHFLAALEGKASQTSETSITVTRIFEYVSEKVPKTVKACYGDDKTQEPWMNMSSNHLFVVALLPEKKGIMSDTSTYSHLGDNFDQLYDILCRVEDVDLRRICRYVGIEYGSLRDGSHNDKSYALVERLEKRGELHKLAATLRKHFPHYLPIED